MRRLLSYILIVIVALFIGAPLNAELFGGVTITRGSVSDQHVDENPSFAAFKSYLHNLKPSVEIGDRDYYTSINIEKDFPDENRSCHDKSSSSTGFFESRSSVTLVTLDIIRLSGHLGTSDVYKDIPLIYAGENFDPITNKESKRTCFFNVSRFNTPFIRHEGRNQKEDFNLTFKIHTTERINYEILGAINSSFLVVSALLDWTDLTGARIQKIEDGITNLQKLVPSTFDMAKSYQEPLLTPGEKDLSYDIFMPAIEEKNDHAVINVELSASMLLDNIDDKEVTVGRVLEDTEIGANHCIPEIPAPKCQIVNQTFGDAFHQSVYGKTTPSRFFDFTPEGEKKVLDTCEAIRDFASTKLQLSTLDALLVRWAAVKQGKLDKALADPAKARAIAHAVSTATGSPTKPDNIIYACWNDEDQKTLVGVLKAMGKTLAP